MRQPEGNASEVIEAQFITNPVAAAVAQSRYQRIVIRILRLGDDKRLPDIGGADRQTIKKLDRWSPSEHYLKGTGCIVVAQTKVV